LALTHALRRLSFRWQITLLGALAAILLLAVLIATISALRFTKSAVLNDEKRRLVETTQELVREYSAKAQSAWQNGEASPLQNPVLGSSRDVLTLLNRIVLQNVEGVESGFYSKSVDSLIGTAFPISENQEESSSDSAVSADTHAVILQVARTAAQSGQPSRRVVSAANDFLIIEAAPIQEGQEITGSAWTAKKLTGLPGTNRFRAYLATAGLGAAALACVVLTLLVVRNLQSGVQKVESGLANLEHNLEAKIPVESDPDEIRQIARAINRLGLTLKQRIEHEKQIEDQLMHSERLAALGRLIAGVAHEVRNPLATIRLRVQMCQEEAENPRVQHSCEIALEEIERLNGMVNRLLNFSQPVHLHIEPTDISRLVHQRLASLADKAQHHGVRVVTTLPEKSEVVNLDQSRMAQVFDNLIQNAIDAMAERGGILCVNVTPQTGTTSRTREMWVEFNDTGEGIPSEVLGRIFDPFFTTKQSGTGLGLSISRELVRAHGGDICVRSAEGHGTTVRVILPVRNGRMSAQSA
jgi:signal transduction histidine kinase